MYGTGNQEVPLIKNYEVRVILYYAAPSFWQIGFAIDIKEVLFFFSETT